MKAEDTYMDDQAYLQQGIKPPTRLEQAELSFMEGIREAKKEEVAFLGSILHLPFFEFCLQVKERKQKLEQLLEP